MWLNKNSIRLFFQAEKDAKRKARAKELKKLKKAKEKKAEVFILSFNYKMHRVRI